MLGQNGASKALSKSTLVPGKDLSDKNQATPYLISRSNSAFTSMEESLTIAEALANALANFFSLMIAIIKI